MKKHPDIFYRIVTIEEAARMLGSTEYALKEHDVNGFCVLIKIPEMNYLGPSNPLTKKFRESYVRSLCQ